jgi:hypothetical protein
MSLLDRLEGWLERGIEGLFRRAPGRVQPLEIGRRLARLLEEQKQVSVSTIYVPNSFLVQVPPPDYARLTSLSSRLTEELAEHLSRLVQRQRYALVGPLTVAWAEAADLAPGAFRTEASFVAAAPLPAAEVGSADTPEKTTMVFRRAGDAAAVPRSPGVAGAAGGMAPRLSVTGGPDARRTIRLRPGENRVGRAEDNDLVLGDTNVSRYHAVLIWEGGETRLRDLGSRNGTRRHGELVEEALLVDGDELQVGLDLLVYRER